MKKVYLIHGWSGSPNEPMHQWLVSELEKAGFDVEAPEMRTKDLMAIHDVIYDKSSETEQDAFSAEVSKYIDAIADYLRKKIK